MSDIHTHWQHDPSPYGSSMDHVLRASVTLMSVSPETAAWLDIEAPGWRERVGLAEINAQVRVTEYQQRQHAQTLVYIQRQLAWALADRIVSSVEPEIKGDKGHVLEGLPRRQGRGLMNP
jgi:hypothetical protein